MRRRALLSLLLPLGPVVAVTSSPLHAHAAGSLTLSSSYTEVQPAGNNSPAAYGTAPQPFASVAVGDLSANGQQKVVAAFPDGRVVLLNSGLGVDNGAWPRSAGAGPVHSAPTLADLNGDGHLQVITTSESGLVNVWNPDGSNYPGWPRTSHPMASNFPPGFFGTVAAGDLFGDGGTELVAGSWDHTLYAWDRNGNVLGGFPINLWDTVWDTPALADLEHIGRMDIIEGSDSSGGSTEPYPAGGVYWAFRGTGVPMAGWPQLTNQVPWASVAVADLHSNGRNTVVAGSGLYYPGPAGNQVNVWDENGAHQWTGATSDRNFASPAIGYLNGSKVVVEPSLDGAVHVWDANGNQLWARNPGWGSLWGSAVIAPYDSSGQNGVWITAGQHLLAYDASGNLVYDTALPGISWASPTVASLDGSTLSVITVSQGSGASPQNETRWAVNAYQIPGTAASMLDPVAKGQWPTFHGNNQRTGNNLGMLGPAPPPTAADHGYWMVARDGGMFTYGVPYYGSMGGAHLNQPIVGIARTPDGGGYWAVASDGGIFSFGNARFKGSTGNIHLNQPIVGMASTPDGGGYWMVASDGGIFSFGNAHFYGSTGNIRLNQPIVGMTPTPDGGGYWMVARDGGIFSFGNAHFFGSTGNIRLNQPIVGMAAYPGGGGYWMVASDGGIFSFGSARFFGSTGNIHLNQPIVAMASTSDGQGYWMAASDGGIFTFGNAAFRGSAGNLQLVQPVVGMTSWG
jgi:WD40 repeat protein